MNIASLTQAVAGLSWLLVIVVVVLVVVRASRGQRMRRGPALVIATVLLAGAFNTVSAGLVFIQPEERGVVISALPQSQGVRPQPLEPGLRWIIPFFESVVRYRVSKQTYTMSSAPEEGQIPGDDSVTARTADGQEIFVDASVIFSVSPVTVVDLHRTWQNRYVNELVRPLARGVIRDAVSQFGVEEVVTSNRFDLIEQIREATARRLAENGLVLEDFVLRNITFTPEYAASVEQKQIAEQRALEAGLVVEQRRQEAEQARQIAQGEADAVVIRAQGDAQARLIQAEAEAQALQMIADVLRDNPDLLTFEYIDKLAPGVRVMLVPNDNPFLLPLPSLETGTVSPSPPVPTPVPTPETSP